MVPSPTGLPSWGVVLANGDSDFLGEMAKSRRELESAAAVELGSWVGGRLPDPDFFITWTYDPQRVADGSTRVVFREKPSLGVGRRGRGGRSRTGSLAAEDSKPARIVLPPAPPPRSGGAVASVPKAVRDIRRILPYIGKALGSRHLEYVFAVEKHKSGAAHVHGMLKIEGGGTDGDRKLIWFILFTRFGRTDVTRPHDALHVSNYVAKYVAKDAAEIVFSGGRRVTGGGREV